MLTNRENLIAALEGGKPERIPFTTYADFGFTEPGLSELERLGFCQSQYTGVVKEKTGNVERLLSQTVCKGQPAETITLRTPVGQISQTSLNGWVQDYFLKTAQDYCVMEYIVRHTSLESDYSRFQECEQRAGDNGITLIWGRRTPIQTILVDYAGVENLAFHMADFPTEVEGLLDALLEQLIETYRIIAAGPGRYVHLLENMTAEIWGPGRFARYHLPAYEKALPFLQAGGKKVYAHYDGKLKSVAHLVAQTTIDGIESFTVAPEGDMCYEEARAQWPQKFIWSNISPGIYRLADRELRAWVRDAVARCSPDGRLFALAVLEDIPENWREKIPVILEELAR